MPVCRKPFRNERAHFYTLLSGVCASCGAFHSRSAEENCPTVNVSSLRSVKVATPPCAVKAAIPCGLAVRKQHKMLFAVSKFEKETIDFVLETVKQLIEKHGTDLSTETLIHSDQGSHYTSIKFIQLLKDNELRQSMSRRANCWDNAPQESFFGHMKDELDLSECYSYEEILNAVRDWTEYYNTERYQWDLARLSPVEYYQYLTTGIYPLLNPKAKGENNQSEASL